MKKNKIVIGIIISLIIISCDSSTIPSDNLQIFPLKEGNIWIYQNYSVYNNDSLIKTYLDTTWIMTDTIVNNYKFYYVNKTGFLYDLGYYHDSLFANVDPRNENSKPSPIYAVPCTAGDVYFSDFGKCRIINTDTLISIKSGTFRCIKYEFSALVQNGQGFKNYHYCCPGIGLVKMESFYNSYSNLDKYVKGHEMELINFKVK